VTGDEARVETSQPPSANWPVGPVLGAIYNETRDATPEGYLAASLDDASRGHVDPEASIEPIRALIERGCDLEADILPVIAREVPGYRAR
jgi:hypothetical protein